MTDPDIVRSAIALAFCGMFVFPVRDKVPLTEHGFHDAISAAAVEDADVIRELFHGIAATGIGVDCGRSGLLVVDIDGPTAEHQWRSLEGANGEITTIAVKTSRGRHLWLRSRDPRARNTTSKLGGGIDTRGAGGYVLVPPSLHPSGHRYSWRVTIGVGLAPAPEWLLELLAPPPPPLGERRSLSPGERLTAYGRVALEGLIDELLAAGEGTRNDTLLAVSSRAGRLEAAGEIDAHLAKTALVEAAMQTGLQFVEAETTFDNGFEFGQRYPAARQQK